MDHGTQLKLLKYLEAHPQVSQRELAQHLGISLGKANYCLRALIGKGLVKARNFKNSDNKRSYLYLLTPQGIERKATITVAFLQRKMEEYEALKAEIAELREDVVNNGGHEN
ncbi:MAG: MarR family EPS-associated transcriptional regulator [Xanthomonadales bacterium]|nr:MarR family EPS-associated transcriptional regulator [Xanthomonadales bacterium]